MFMMSNVCQVFELSKVYERNFHRGVSRKEAKKQSSQRNFFKENKEAKERRLCYITKHSLCSLASLKKFLCEHCFFASLREKTTPAW
jgi:hypothetical protein